MVKSIDLGSVEKKRLFFEKKDFLCRSEELSHQN